MRPAPKNLVAVLALLPLCVLAGTPKAKPKAKKAPAMKVEVPRLDMSGLGALPSTDGLTGPKATEPQQGPKVTTSDIKYEVVKVEQARNFVRGAGGVRAEEPLPAIGLYGNPPTLEKFTTWVRVHATQPMDTSIELVVLDPHGDTALTGNGELAFGKKTDTDFLLDWAPTPRPDPGEYKLLIRIGGQPMGTWPLKVEKKN